jgi:hypothetical protein
MADADERLIAGALHPLSRRFNAVGDRGKKKWLSPPRSLDTA